MNTRIVIMLALLCGVTGTVQSTPPQDPPDHVKAVKVRFHAMISAESQTAAMEISNDLRAYLATKLTDKQRPVVVFRYAIENPSPYVLILVKLMMQTTDDPLEIARVWAAGLDAEDDKTRNMAVSLLGLLDTRDGGRNFDFYQSLLAEKPEAMSVNLVTYMFDADAGQALLTLADAAAGNNRNPARLRELLYAHHMIEHADWLTTYNFEKGRDAAAAIATEELKRLADAPEWWARLYAAHVLRRHTAWRDDAMMNKLANDEHPTVQQMIQPLRR